MSRPRLTLQAPDQGLSDPGTAQVGCVIGFFGALVGDAIATVALLVLRFDWLFGPQRMAEFPLPILLVTVLVTFAIGWVLAAALGMLVGLSIAFKIGYALEKRRVAATYQVWLFLIVAAPVVVAALSLWWFVAWAAAGDLPWPTAQ